MERKWSVITRCALLLASSLTSATSLAASEAGCAAPEPYVASYQAEMDKMISLKGSGTQRLRPLGNETYLLSFDVESMVADMHESVAFSWDQVACQLVPLQYQRSLKGALVPDRLSSFENNRDESMITGEYKGKAFSVEARDDYVDPLGLQIQVRQDLRAGKREMVYRMVYKGRILTDRYRVVGEESVYVSGKDYRTVKIEKVRPETSDRQSYMWMAPELDYALVRMLHVEPGGEKYEVVIKAYKTDI